MKKVFLIVGILLILLMIGVWAYVFLKGGPSQGGLSDIFANFGDAGDAPEFTDTTPGEGWEDGGESENPFTSVKRLRQISTKSAAGAVYTGGSVRFIERGTGYIYDVDAKTGSEKRVSGLTIPRTIRAEFSPQGDRVAVTYQKESGLTTVVGVIPSGSDMNLVELPDGATEVGFTNQDDILFFVPTSAGGVGYKYVLETDTKTELFKTPLTDIQMLWGSPTSYFYSTPSYFIDGAVYKVSSSPSYVTSVGKGLTAFSYGDGLLVGKQTEQGQVVIDVAHGPIPVPVLIPDKCASKVASSSVFYCGSPTNIPASTKLPDDWYKGVAAFSDAILEINASSSSMTVVSMLEEESGRPIDIADMGIAPDGSLLYFVNKYDGGLWVLDL